MKPTDAGALKQVDGQNLELSWEKHWNILTKNIWNLSKQKLWYISTGKKSGIYLRRNSETLMEKVCNLSRRSGTHRRTWSGNYLWKNVRNILKEKNWKFVDGQDLKHDGKYLEFIYAEALKHIDGQDLEFIFAEALKHRRTGSGIYLWRRSQTYRRTVSEIYWQRRFETYWLVRSVIYRRKTSKTRRRTRSQAYRWNSGMLKHKIWSMWTKLKHPTDSIWRTMKDKFCNILGKDWEN